MLPYARNEITAGNLLKLITQWFRKTLFTAWFSSELRYAHLKGPKIKNGVTSPTHGQLRADESDSLARHLESRLTVVATEYFVIS